MGLLDGIAFEKLREPDLHWDSVARRYVEHDTLPQETFGPFATFREMSDAANDNLRQGAPKAAPFDRIIIEGAIETLPDSLSAQLVEGGRIVAARREGNVTRLVQGVKAGGTIALRAFADMDVAALPGFGMPKSFQF